MIFKTKRKSNSEEKNWCVVLKSFSSALDRTRLVQKLQKAFEISNEDALDVMQNTPIILLDHLVHEEASKLKDFFSDHGVEIALTNDSFYKRRCYRTVWPATPNLEVILKPAISSPVSISAQNGASHFGGNTRDSGRLTTPPLTEAQPAAPAWNTSQKEFLEQKDLLIRDSLKLQEEVARLRSMVDRSLQQVTEKERALQVLTTEKKDRDSEIQRLEAQLAATEEKFKIAREEFRDTRTYFEERLLTQETKMQEFQARAEEMNQLLRESQNAHADLQKNIQSERDELETARANAASGELEWEKRTASLRHELDLHKRTIQDYEAKLAYLEASRKQTEDRELRAKEEMEKQVFETKNQEIRLHQLEKELERTKNAVESQEKAWASRLQEIEFREKELESARRQIKELQTQMEHRELIQRKVFIAEQISSKELRLKSLVKKQEQLEVEARGRENELKKLLEEQETVEKGLIEDRQAQRHLLEKLKNESSSEGRMDQDVAGEWKPRP